MKGHWSYMLTIPLAILAKAVKAARQTSPRTGFARVDALVEKLGVAGPDRLCSAAFLTFADMGYGSPTSEQGDAIGAQEVFHGFRDQAPLGFPLDYPRAVVPLPACENAVLHIPPGGPLFATEEVTPRALERDSRRGNGPLADARYESSCINVGRRLRAQLFFVELAARRRARAQLGRDLLDVGLGAAAAAAPGRDVDHASSEPVGRGHVVL